MDIAAYIIGGCVIIMIILFVRCYVQCIAKHDCKQPPCGRGPDPEREDER
jgi:hypothetical protein